MGGLSGGFAQWLQLLRDAEMCSPLCSAAEINRLSAEVIQHPDVVDEVFDDPHGPYMYARTSSQR